LTLKTFDGRNCGLWPFRSWCRPGRW